MAGSGFIKAVCRRGWEIFNKSISIEKLRRDSLFLKYSAIDSAHHLSLIVLSSDSCASSRLGSSSASFDRSQVHSVLPPRRYRNPPILSRNTPSAGGRGRPAPRRIRGSFRSGYLFVSEPFSIGSKSCSIALSGYLCFSEP